MSFDGHSSTAFLGNCDFDDVGPPAGEAESGDGDRASSGPPAGEGDDRSPLPDSASPGGPISSTSQFPRNAIKTLRSEGEGKLREDDSKDELDAGSVGTWHSWDNPKDPKGGNLKVSCNLTPCFNNFPPCCNSLCLGIMLTLAWQLDRGNFLSVEK